MMACQVGCLSLVRCMMSLDVKWPVRLVISSVTYRIILVTTVTNHIILVTPVAHGCSRKWHVGSKRCQPAPRLAAPRGQAGTVNTAAGCMVGLERAADVETAVQLQSGR